MRRRRSGPVRCRSRRLRRDTCSSVPGGRHRSSVPNAPAAVTQSATVVGEVGSASMAASECRCHANRRCSRMWCAYCGQASPVVYAQLPGDGRRGRDSRAPSPRAGTTATPKQNGVVAEAIHRWRRSTELQRPPATAAVHRLAAIAARRRVTLLTATRDGEHSGAEVLRRPPLRAPAGRGVRRSCCRSVTPPAGQSEAAGMDFGRVVRRPSPAVRRAASTSPRCVAAPTRRSRS